MFDIPKEGGIELLIGQKTGAFLCFTVDPRDYGFNPSYLSPNITIIKSQLSPELIMSGEIDIDHKLFNQNYLSFLLNESQLNDLSMKLNPSMRTT